MFDCFNPYIKLTGCNASISVCTRGSPLQPPKKYRPLKKNDFTLNFFSHFLKLTPPPPLLKHHYASRGVANDSKSD